MEKFVLIDGNSLLNRAFYATPAFTTKEGIPTNGVFGFVKLLLKILSDKNPAYLAVAFDLPEPTFRHKMYDGYKAGRKPMPEELAVQFPILKEVLRIMGVKICELSGYEADDIIGTLSRKFDVLSYIYTGDRDSYQLVNDKTTVCYTRKGVSDLLELTNANFKDEIGLEPLQIIDEKALMGDKSDNIPGVAGIGEKSALTLLQTYHDVNGVYAHLDEIGGALNRKLTNGRQSAFFSKKLATIDLNVPLAITLQECVIKMPFPYALKEKFAELEFKTLLTQKIYEDGNTADDSSQAETKKKKIEIQEIMPVSVSDVKEALLNSTAKEVALYWTEKEFRFYLPEEGRTSEYFLPIKVGLLDVGFSDYELVSLLQAIFEGERKVLSYNTKELMHRLCDYDLQFQAAYEDVGILKCLSDGLSNVDGLDFCLNYFSLPEQHKAYGVYWLYIYYTGHLNAKEWSLYTEVELPLVRVLFDMEREGVCVDGNTLQALSQKYKAEVEELTEKIYEAAGMKFNINSTQQLGKILFERLRIGVGAKKKETKNYKTTAEELEKYADEHEIIPMILRYRKIQKIVSTYIDGFKPLIQNGKVHTTYNQSNTQTGRLSSANPNLQNIPIRTDEGRELRKLFTARKGNVLIDADYSQIELRLLAHFSGCKELAEAYCEGRDIHTITASQVFDTPPEQVTPEMRRNAKAVNFGIIYGISAFGLGKDLNIPTKKAQEYINRYFASYSDVKKYMNKNVETAMQDGYVTTLLGRRRVINELRSSNYNVRSFGERAAMNMPLQGSSADIIKIAMIGVHRRLNEGNYQAKLVLQVHDELVIDCPEMEVEEVGKILQEEMENAVQLKVPLTVEIGVGKNWYETK